MKTGKIITSLCFTAAVVFLCLSLQPVTVSAAQEGDYTYTVSDGAATITDYTGSASNLTIPSTLGSNPVTTIGNEAFSHCPSLTSVAIPDSVTDIRDNAFSGCTGLTRASIPDNIIIGNFAFFGCDSLTDVYYTGTESQWASITIGVNNDELKNATVHYTSDYGICGDNLTWMLDSEGTLTISGVGSMYNYINDLNDPKPWNGNDIIEIIIENGVTSIGNWAFAGCDYLQSVTIPDSVTTIGNAAFCDSSLQNVVIPDSVTTIGKRAFELSDLQSVTIGNGITTISDRAFATSTLQSVIIGDNIATIGLGAFFGANIQNLTIPNSVITIGEEAFSGCESLQNIVIPESVTTIGKGAFYYCRDLHGIWVDENNVNYSSDERGVLFNKDKTILIQAPGAILGSYAIPNSVITIVEAAFSWCSGLQSITLPVCTVDIGNFAFEASNLEEVFYSGTEADVNIPNLPNNPKLKDALWHYAQKEKINGWVSEDGKWYCYKDNERVTGWLQDGTTWYYLDSEGVMLTGWQFIGGKWYYLKPSGAMATGWAQVSGVWYYLESSGAMATGWQQVGSTWYYFKSSGAMATGWLQVGSTWYYFKSSGAMATGWLQVGNTWYYFNSSGAMKTGWLNLGGVWYYFHGSGVMATGSVKIGTKTYRFNTSGACLNP